MKKIILSLAVVAGLVLTSCNSAENAEKLDFTKSYENAALALETAQTKLTTALASHDTAQIASAKAELQTAQANYEQTKKELIANGGTVKPQYEQALQQSNTTLSTAAQSIATTAATTVANSADTAIRGVANRAVDHAKQNLINSGKEAQQKVNNELNAQKTRFNEDAKKKKEEAEKNINDNVNKATDKLKNLLQ